MSSKYFDNARTMFLTEGWTEFQQELDEAIAVCTLDACTTTEEFWQMRGRLTALRQMAGYENAVLAAEASEDA